MHVAVFCQRVGERAARESLNDVDVGVSPLSAQLCLYAHTRTLVHTCVYTHHCDSQHKALKLTCLNQQSLARKHSAHALLCGVDPLSGNLSSYVPSGRGDSLRSAR